MECIFSVEETGEEDFVPDDNSRAIKLGCGEVSVELFYERVGTGQALVAITTNQIVEPDLPSACASAKVFLPDAGGTPPYAS